MDEEPNVTHGLRAAKGRRRAAAASCNSLAEVERKDAALEAAAQADVAKLERMYDSFVAAGAVAVHGRDQQQAITQVLACKSGLLRASVTLDIAKSRSAASRSKHAAASAELREAESDVAQCARTMIDFEMVDLANAFNEAFDRAMAIGAQLQSLSQRNLLHVPVNEAVRTLPKPVELALERMPKPDPFNTPVHILRYGVSSDAWKRRLDALIGDAPIDLRAA